MKFKNVSECLQHISEKTYLCPGDYIKLVGNEGEEITSVDVYNVCGGGIAHYEIVAEINIGAELRKIEEVLEAAECEDFELYDSVDVSIQIDSEMRGFERTIKRTGCISSLFMEYGELFLWDDVDNERVYPSDVKYGIEDVIKSFWEMYNLKKEEGEI